MVEVTSKQRLTPSGEGGLNRLVAQALPLLFLVTFLFPTIPKAFPNDTQPWYLLFAILVCLWSKRFSKRSLVFIWAVLLASLIEFSSGTAFVVLGLLGYVLTLEASRSIKLPHLELAIAVVILVSGTLLALFQLDQSSYFSLRSALGLRDMSAMGRFAAFWGENSVLLIFMVQVHIVISLLQLDRRIRYAWLFLVSTTAISVGGALYLLLPFAVLWWVGEQLFSAQQRISILNTLGYAVFGATFLLFALYAGLSYEINQLVHRSEMVRLYDLMMIPYGFIENFWGLRSSLEVQAAFGQDYPERYTGRELGSTSAIARIVFELGGLPTLVLVWLFARIRGVQLGIFFLFCSTTIGIGLYFLFLLVCKGEAGARSGHSIAAPRALAVG